MTTGFEMVNSDYPHGLGGSGGSMASVVRNLPGITDAEKDDLLSNSARAVFGIDPATRKQVRNGVAAAGAATGA